MRISDWSSDVCSSDLLGSNRTLVLVDGRRTVSNSGISNLVSLSTIPSDFIDRVEIITGGTSSVYGSDAVAGVVNIITKKNERGLTLRARAGRSEEHTSELQSLMRISYAVFCLKQKKMNQYTSNKRNTHHFH